jgi:hypothetical protein
MMLHRHILLPTPTLMACMLETRLSPSFVCAQHKYGHQHVLQFTAWQTGSSSDGSLVVRSRFLLKNAEMMLGT